MARSRNIELGFFRNELLGEPPPLARLVFAGLWAVSDRQGRLEDRPQRIKPDLLPYDDCDIGSLLDDLAGAGFIERSTVGGEGYIQVTRLDWHQNPHARETASTILPPVRLDTGVGRVLGLDPDSPVPATDRQYAGAITGPPLGPVEHLPFTGAPAG